MRDSQAALGVAVDVVWGPATKAAIVAALWDARRCIYVTSWRRPPRAPPNDAVALDDREPKAAFLEPLRPQAEAAAAAVPVDPLHHRPPTCSCLAKAVTLSPLDFHSRTSRRALSTSIFLPMGAQFRQRLFQA